MSLLMCSALILLAIRLDIDVAEAIKRKIDYYRSFSDSLKS